METKSKLNRFAAVFLALAMLLTLIPFSSIARAEEAASGSGNTYVLEAKDMKNTYEKGKAPATPETAGTGSAPDFFKLVYRTDQSVIEDKSEVTFEKDTYQAGKRRISMGSTNASGGYIEFTTNAAAKLKIWWVGNTDSSRYIYITDSAGNTVAELKQGAEGGQQYISEVDLPADDVYHINNKSGTNYIYKIEVAEVPATSNYILEAKDMKNTYEKGKAPATPETAGTGSAPDFFKLVYRTDQSVIEDKSEVTFEKDTYQAGKRRISMGSTNASGGYIEFTTNAAAKLKIWWVGNTDSSRYIYITDSAGNTVAELKQGTEGGQQYISEVDLPADDVYHINNKSGTNYIYKVEVEVGAAAPVVRDDWATVAVPEIGEITQSSGTITVPVTADVSKTGGDMVTVTMFDENGTVIDSKESSARKDSHSLTFSPKASGTYTFKAALSRKSDESGEYKDKESAEKTYDYVLPLGTPTITAATNKGNGSVELEWTAVTEAEGYNIYNGETKVASTTGEKSTVVTVSEGLEVGKKASFYVAAVRKDTEGSKSDAREVTITAESQSKWSTIFYGTSTSSSKNKVTGDINEGSVTVSAMGNAGKILLGSGEGVTYYYATVPTDKNFIFRAKIKLDKWTYDNGQEGFGLLALDSLPENPNNTEVHWTNQYMLGVSKIEYRWDSEKETFADPDNADYPKYSMSLGIGATIKSGMTPSNIAAVKAQTDTALTNKVAPKVYYPMEHSAVGKGAGNYNIVGNLTNAPTLETKSITTIDELTEFEFEIRKNNTGYFLTYYAPNGEPVVQKFYDTEALSQLDKDNVYVGFFTARNAEITINQSDCTLELRDPSQDPEPEEKPVTKVEPTLSITSATVSNTPDYNLMMTSNVAGSAAVSVNDKLVATVDMAAGELASKTLSLASGRNTVTVVFTPDAKQDLGEDTVLASTAPITKEIRVTYNTNYADQNNLYVAPDGKSNGNGGPEYPLDIYTAISVVQPGQTIVLMEGTYALTAPVRIERGIDGTADEPIKMIADPEAKTRPVFDFTGSSEGIRLGGNYWYMQGFDVTKSSGTGMRVCGNNNIIDRVDLYSNGNTGLQISAFRDSSDPVELRPQNNLILNCTSYNNADPTGQDADGFAAKLTVGEGNVFDGCVAYNNTDDGWDLYARVSSGTIGAVTIKNCVAYDNGHNIAGTIKGNGNGFKLGGENLPAGHKIINSISFNNDADGITSNSCPDVQVIDCTSYNNGKKDLNLYTNNTNITTSYKVEGVVVGAGGYEVKKNATDTSEVGENAVKTATDADFVSTKFEGLNRKENGTIDLGDFLKLKDATEAGADFDKEGGSTPSEDIGEIVPDENLPEPTTPEEPTPEDPTPETPDDKKDLGFEDNDIKVTAPADAFDNAGDITFNADPVADETTDTTFTFDLSFTDKDGNKVQPNKAVTVRIPVPAALKDKTIYVYHVENDGKYTEISCKVENGMVVFTASSFSKYIITTEKLAESNPSTGYVPGIGLVILAGAVAAACVFRKRSR